MSTYYAEGDVHMNPYVSRLTYSIIDILYLDFLQICSYDQYMFTLV